MARKKTGLTLFNPNPTPVVFNEAGQIVGGGGRREVDELDAAGQEAVDAGLLVREEPDGDEAADLPQPKEAAPRARDKETGASGTSKPA